MIAKHILLTLLTSLLIAGGSAFASVGQEESAAPSLTAAAKVESRQQDPQPGRTPLRQSMEERYRLGFQGVAVPSGLQIVSVTPAGPATNLRRPSDGAMLTLEPGDLITNVNDQEVRTFPQYYAAMQACSQTGGRVLLTVRDIRTGDSTEVEGLADLQCVRSNQPRPPGIAYRLRFTSRPDEASGLKVLTVDPEGPLSRLMLPEDHWQQASAEAGDVILRIGDVAIASQADYRRAMERIARRCGQASIQLRNVRTGEAETWDVKAVLTQVDDALVQRPTPHPPQRPMPPDEPTRGKRAIHLVLCGLTNDPGLGPMAAISLERLDRLFEDRIGDEFIGSRTTLDGDECNASTILETVERLQVRPQDTVFCFYIGHGAHTSFFDMDDPSGGHFFQIPQQDLSRTQLFDALQSKGARLTVLISDTCNVESPVPPAFGPARPELKAELIRGLTGFEKLLLETRGVVNISASAPGESSWLSIPIGGWFTEQFANTMLADPPTWAKAYAGMRQRTSEFFKVKRQEILDANVAVDPRVRTSLEGQDDLRPTAFQLSVKPDPYREYDHTQEREMRKTHYSFFGLRRY